METGATSPSYGDGVLGPAEGKSLCKRLSIRRGLEAGAANTIAAVFVFLYLGYLAPDERVGHPVSQLHNTIVFVVFLLMAGGVCGRLGDRRLHRALAWLHEGRPPNPDERGATLAMRYAGLMVAAVESTLGDSFGLAEQPGFAQTGDFALHAVGPFGAAFNFGDSERGFDVSPLAWLAHRFQRPVDVVWPHLGGGCHTSRDTTPTTGRSGNSPRPKVRRRSALQSTFPEGSAGPYFRAMRPSTRGSHSS